MQSIQHETKSKKKDKVRYAVVGLGYIAQIAVLPAFAQVEVCERPDMSQEISKAAVTSPPQLVKAASPGLD
jgi:predicted dehydrogenase